MTGRKALLNGALKSLNERERHILIERRLKDNPTTLEELSQQYNISRERVRQIEVRAFEKLQKAMKAQIAERRMALHTADGELRASRHPNPFPPGKGARAVTNQNGRYAAPAAATARGLLQPSARLCDGGCTAKPHHSGEGGPSQVR